MFSLGLIAGIFKQDSFQEMKAETLRESYEVNVVGPLMFTQVHVLFELVAHCHGTLSAWEILVTLRNVDLWCMNLILCRCL